MIDEKFIEQIATKVMKQLATNQEFPQTPVGVSNRHIHLSQSHMEALFGHGYKLTKLKDLKQPGQFAAKETVMIIGPKGIINNVRILGPLRQETQVEVSITDCYKLGVNAPIRESGQIEGTPGIVIKVLKESLN